MNSIATTELPPPGEGWALDDPTGFPGLIGPIWVRRDGGLRYGLVAGPQHLNRDGALHGGMFMALFDHALGFAAFEAGQVRRLVTIQLSAHFISGADEGDFLELESQVVRQTGSYLFMRGLCYCRGRLLATSDGIWKKFGK
jgi:acyl-coenzyme A thioesterase PaaI-like protein